MKLPKTLDIGAVRFDVEAVQNLRNDDGKWLYGEISYSDCKISVDKKYIDGQRLPFTLWHEVLHGILEQAGLDAKEKVLEALSYGIVDALRRNEILRMNDDQRGNRSAMGEAIRRDENA